MDQRKLTPAMKVPRFIFFILLCGMALATPLTLSAQQNSRGVISGGFLAPLP